MSIFGRPLYVKMISLLNSGFDAAIWRGIFSFRGNVYSVNILGWVVVLKFIRTWSPRCAPLGSKSCFRIDNEKFRNFSILFRRIRVTLNRPFVQNSENSRKQNSPHVWNEAKPNASVLEFEPFRPYRIKLTNIMVFKIKKKDDKNLSVFNLKVQVFCSIFENAPCGIRTKWPSGSRIPL